MMYHVFHNSMWKVVRIAKTSDCKTLLILKWPPLYRGCRKQLIRTNSYVVDTSTKYIRFYVQSLAKKLAMKFYSQTFWLF